MTVMMNLTAKQISSVLGGVEIAKRLGVTPQAVSNHVVRGVFPARYYKAMKALADEQGVALSMSLFDFAERTLPAEAAQ